MIKIKLGCKTGGFKYGDIVTIGTKKGEMKKADAEKLVEERLAYVHEYAPKEESKSEG